MQIIKNSSGDFFKLLNKIKDAENDKVDIGWFNEQGKHHSGMSYPELARVHLNGVRVPKRDILGVAMFLHNPKTDKAIKRAIRKWLRKNNLATKDLFLMLGRVEKKNITETFGNSLLGITLNPTPLVDTGEWKSKTAFKLRSEGKIRRR